MSSKMTEQIIKDWQVPSRQERETILTYEEEINQWHIYTDVQNMLESMRNTLTKVIVTEKATVLMAVN